MNIGSKIEKLRKEKGLTRVTLAQEIKEPIHVIRALEYGSVPQNIAVILPKIAKALDASLNEIFGVPVSGNGPIKTAHQIEGLVQKLLYELNQSGRY
jgi:ribosome-binding protein aMBF1 (putative translation factor)